MKKFAKYIPYLVAVLIFVGLAYAYAPEVLDGKVVNQSDISAWQGMAKEANDYNAANPDDPTFWSDSMFGGMPTYAFAAKWEGDWTEPLYKALFWGKRPPSYLIICLLGAFLMFLAFGVSPWLSIAGAIAVTFCSYNMQIIQVGHNAKMVAIAFMPWVIASLVYGYRRNTLLGAVFFALSMSFEIKANHPQISYYLAFIVFALIISELVHAIRTKAFASFVKKSCVFLVGGLLGLAVNANNLVPLYDYQGYTMRGGSELSADASVKSGKGLKMDYATAWSYGIEETPNLLIPNFNGGATVSPLSKNSATYKVLKGRYQGADRLIEQMPTYWGPQPFTAGPMYIGAIALFLCVLGICVLDNRYKWALAIVGLISVFLAWGSNMMWFSKLFFKYVPLYNKFRTVSTALTVLQITVPLLGILAVHDIFSGKVTASRLKVGLIISGALTAGFCLLVALFPGIAGDFHGASDVSYPKDIVAGLVQDRASLLRADAFRSLLFIALATVVILLVNGRKLKTAYGAGALALLILVDFWGVDRRFLNSEHFMPRKQFNNAYPLREADKYILEDKEDGYRVLDLSESTFNSSYTSYYHNSIGGYSPAKLSRYQDLIDVYLGSELEAVREDINKAISRGAATYADLEDAIGEYPVLSMLNTRYIIVDGKAAPLQYTHGNGAAWTVEAVRFASGADEEMNILGDIDPLNVAVIAGKPFDYAPAGLPAKVELSSSSPKEKRYIFDCEEDKVVVLSSIWYPSGWEASVDGAPMEILRADYVLQALKVSAGRHEIVMAFNPAIVTKGKAVSTASSAILLLMVMLAFIGMILEHRKVAKGKSSLANKEVK